MQNQRLRPLLSLLIFIFIASSCKREKENQLSIEEQKDGWQLLFDGKTLSGWHLYNKPETSSAWIVVNNELSCLPSDSNKLTHGDLVTNREFENYDLKFEWKMEDDGNSGVFINVTESPEIPTAWASGPEYQLLGDAHPDFKTSPKKRAGCLYSFQPHKNQVSTRPAGEWNNSRIKQINGVIEFYLNGVLTATEDLKSDNWKNAITTSSFSYFPDFGKSSKGRIALQDWAKGVSFRNIKIKEL